MDPRDDPAPLVDCETCAHFRWFRRIGEPRCQMKHQLTFHLPRDYSDEWGYLARCDDFDRKLERDRAGGK